MKWLETPWPQRRLRHLFSLRAEAPQEDDGIVTAFRDGQVALRRSRRTAGFTEALQEVGYQRVRRGDLVIHAMDAFAGAIGVSEATGKCSPVCQVLIPRPSVDARFVAYVLREAARSRFIQSLARGIRERSTDFRWSQAKDVHVPCPDQATQRTVADFLDRECARITNLQRELQAEKDLLRALYVSRRSELLGGCERTITVGRITDFLDGRRVPLNAEERARREGPYPYWGANSIQGFVDDFLFDEPLVLIGEDGAPFFDERRDVAWSVSGKIWVNNHAHVLRTRQGWLDEFVAEALNAVDYSQYITGATRDKLTQADLRGIRVPALDMAEQERVVAELGELRRKAEAPTTELSELGQALQRYRDALIAEAVTRQLEIAAVSEAQIGERLQAAVKQEAVA